MKKIFVLALAAVMTAGMATTSFAYLDNYKLAISVNEDGNANEVYVIDDGKAKKAEKNDNGDLIFDGGDEVVIPIYQWEDWDKEQGKEHQIDEREKNTIAAYTDKDDVKLPKAFATWDEGKADLEVRKVKFDNGDYRYAVVVTMPETDGNKVLDLAGTISIGTSKSAAEKYSYSKFDLVVSYAPNGVDKNEPINVEKYDGGVLTDDIGIVKFDKEAGEIDIEFGDDTALFTVDVTGQGNLNLAWNVDFNKEFAGMYDYANIDFVNFEGKPSFNKTGTLYIYADEDSFIYEVTEDGAKAIKAEWDEDYEAWTFKTRTLKSYAISDVELDEKTVTEDKDDTSSTTDGGKENPDTGR